MFVKTLAAGGWPTLGVPPHNDSVATHAVRLRADAAGRLLSLELTDGGQAPAVARTECVHGVELGLNEREQVVCITLFGLDLDENWLNILLSVAPPPTRIEPSDADYALAEAEAVLEAGSPAPEPPEEIRRMLAEDFSPEDFSDD